jgi:8-oxo-dGTP pyrophosphatase MutT (NUDIX family)
MATKKSAIIPYRFIDEKLEMLLITKTSGDGWGIPKGKIEEPLEPHVSAAKEAFEEAGVLGQTLPVSIGTYLDPSKSGPIPTFLLEVEIELGKKEWPESKRRARLWVNASDCEKYVEDKKLLAVLEKAALCLRSDAEYFKHIIKTLCQERRLSLVTVNDVYAEIESGGRDKRRIVINRKDANVRFSVRAFESVKEPSITFSTQLLQRNARGRIGCWGMEQLEDKFVYSCAHSMSLKSLDEALFAEVVAGLARELNEVDALLKKIR